MQMGPFLEQKGAIKLHNILQYVICQYSWPVLYCSRKYCKHWYTDEGDLLCFITILQAMPIGNLLLGPNWPDIN